MGIILGGIVYLIIASGFISIQVLTAQATDFSQAAQAMANPAIKAFHSVVACIAGFRQRFVYEMLDRIVQVLTPRPKTKAEREAEEAEEAAKKTG
jgi:predicted phage tail protein